MGRTAVVTGGNSGIGRAAAEELARRGFQVVIACRDVARGETAAREINEAVKTERGAGKAVSMQLDLEDFESVRAFVAKFGRTQHGPHVLVCNAGLNTIDNMEQYSSDGFELCWKVRG
jgi:retinol dehydrogenase 12